MANEQRMWQFMAAAAFPGERLTDRFQLGLPDVLWVDGATRVTGLLELKRRARSTRFAFQPGQLPYAHRWWRRGGYAAVLGKTDTPTAWTLWWPEPDPVPWISAMDSSCMPTPAHTWEHYPGTPALLAALQQQPRYAPFTPER